MRKGHRLGRLIVTTCRQASGAPLLDGANVVDDAGRTYGAVVVREPLWRRPASYTPRALVVGWRDHLTPDPGRWPLTREGRRRRAIYRARLARRVGDVGHHYAGEPVAHVNVSTDAHGVRVDGVARG